MRNTKNKSWGGRFKINSDPLLEKFNSSIGFDRKLYVEDIDGSLAHARMLKKIRVLTSSEFKRIERGLGLIKKEIEQKKFKLSDKLEDIHMAIESRLIAKIGKTGGKLHTARSRNDQIALDMRLYCKRKIKELLKGVTNLQKSIVSIAEKKGLVPMPGYTHLQPAQPVLFAHHLLAYFEMLERDKDRLKNTLNRTDISPLGSGALAGSTFKLDREFVAKQLKLSGVTHNSLDAVSDRDFVAELLFDAALVMTHLSRLSEELILWNTREFGFICLPQEFCTGSSMMPQKVNPDVPELVRGKTGRVYGNLIALLTVLKGLPLAYNKDLQEDKEPLFDSLDTVLGSLEILSALVPKIEVDSEKMKKAAMGGFLLATDLADYLVSKKIPFREAHAVVGKIIQYCLQKKKVLERLTLAELRKFSPVFQSDVKSWLSVESAVNRRRSVGGTAKVSVKKELEGAKRLLRKV